MVNTVSQIYQIYPKFSMKMEFSFKAGSTEPPEPLSKASERRTW